MLRANQLDVDRAFIFVIDIQEKLLPLIARYEAIVRASCKLLDGAQVFGLPVLATEQYVKGLGPTHATLRDRLVSHGAEIIEKPTFSACGCDAVRASLARIDRPQAVVIGIEAHICVLQTTLDLLVQDYDVFVCADAIGSRSAVDFDLAVARMRHDGAIVTSVESALFELCERCDTDTFKRMLDIIKAAPPTE